MIAKVILKDLPNGTELLENQVAGHTFQIGSDEIGMLKDKQDGSVMKAAVKPVCGAREIQFYEQLNGGNLKDPNLETMRKFVPEYRGTVKMPFRGKIIDFIKLGDLTHDMAEPCVIDIKIGKRTWDPFASVEKQQAEEQKYEACKQNLGFCIPGFQVYDIKSGRIKRFGKEYGKKLNQNTVKDALKMFLNAETELSRTLLLKLLKSLWPIHTWASTQTSLRLYSSSLLLVYDAKRLKTEIFCNRNSPRNNSNESVPRPPEKEGTSNQKAACNGNTTNLSKPIASSQHHVDQRRSNGHNNHDCSVISNENIQLYRQLQRSHSAQNNYEEEMKEIRKNYEVFLDNLIDSVDSDSTEGRKEWAFVKMIDFAHVFPAEDPSIDTNYLFGIENLVKIFEEFLTECNV